MPIKDNPVKDNPAGRLHYLFKRARTGDKTANGYEVWAAVLKVPFSRDNPNDNTEGEVLGHVLQIRKLIDETEQRLRNIENLDTELYLQPFPSLRHVMRFSSMNVSNYANSLMSQISDGDMTVLAFCAAKLSEFPAEPVIAEELLKELLEDVNALYDQVLESSLEASLKTLILEQLQSIRIAIHEYYIRGIARLREELEKSIGALVVNEDLIKRSNDKEEVKKFGGIITNMATYISIAANLSKLAEMVMRYLPV